MKLKLEIELDTDKQDDLNLIDDIYFQLQDIKEILETRQQNLNKRNNNKQRKDQ